MHVDGSNSEKTSYHDFLVKVLCLSFLEWQLKCGDNIHHTVLSSATELELLNSSIGY